MKKQSKFLALILRHDPAAGNITVDEQGWADVSKVLLAVSSKYGKFSKKDLLSLVALDEKRRYAFNERFDKIRANQGHSNPAVRIDYAAATPPDILYHGTKAKCINDIMRDGLLPMKRSHVHLSTDVNTALAVANRRSGASILLQIDCKAMNTDGHRFCCSENDIWLVKRVPARYITVSAL